MGALRTPSTRRGDAAEWPFDNALTRVICQFVPRRCAQCACISRAFRDQREALRRAEARTALAAAVPLPVAAAIEAVLWQTESRETAMRDQRAASSSRCEGTTSFEGESSMGR